MAGWLASTCSVRLCPKAAGRIRTPDAGTRTRIPQRAKRSRLNCSMQHVDELWCSSGRIVTTFSIQLAASERWPAAGNRQPTQTHRAHRGHGPRRTTCGLAVRLPIFRRQCRSSRRSGLRPIISAQDVAMRACGSANCGCSRIASRRPFGLGQLALLLVNAGQAHGRHAPFGLQSRARRGKCSAASSHTPFLLQPSPVRGVGPAGLRPIQNAPPTGNREARLLRLRHAPRRGTPRTWHYLVPGSVAFFSHCSASPVQCPAAA